MNFDFTDEQEMFREQLARLIREKYDFETRGKIIASEKGYSPEFWMQLAEMGLLMVAFPEEYDGLGGGAVDIMVVMEEFGKGLVVEPYLPTVILAGGVLSVAGGKAARALLPQIGSGDLIMGLGFAEPYSRFDLHHVETTAEKTSHGYCLNGHKSVVLAAPIADKIIISARTEGANRDPDGISLFVLDKDTDGITIEDYQTIDGFRAGDVILDNVTVPADALIGEAGAGLPILEQVIDEAIVAISAEAMGLCQVMSALTLEYTKERQQFGQAIGKFQISQHKMADMFIYTQEMISMTYMATNKAALSENERRKAASAVKIQLGKSCKFVGETAIQLHGGMGITEEMQIGHYFMHATMLENMFGNMDYHYRRYEQVSGLKKAS
ncbi:MAG: acyl-CoA dehydrogenase family protein [bacterium]